MPNSNRNFSCPISYIGSFMSHMSIFSTTTWYAGQGSRFIRENSLCWDSMYMHACIFVCNDIFSYVNGGNISYLGKELQFNSYGERWVNTRYMCIYILPATDVCCRYINYIWKPKLLPLATPCLNIDMIIALSVWFLSISTNMGVSKSLLVLKARSFE